MSLKIALIGNCQVRTYAELLRRTTLDISLEVMNFADPESRIEENRKAFLDRIKDMDFVLSQENSLSFTSFGDTGSVGRIKLVKICNFFFRGTYPDSCYIGNFSRRVGFNDYNSAVILGSYLQNLSIEECLGHFSREAFETLGLLNAWRDSMAELKQRDTSLDFPGAGLTDSLVRRFPAFRTMNHPNDFFLGEYMTTILTDLGIRAPMICARPTSDPLHFLELPIYDFVAEHYGLEYRTPQYLRVYNNFFSLEDYARKNYEEYATWDKSQLVVSSPTDLKREIADHQPSWFLPRGEVMPAVETPAAV